jgi:hypothetical protein
VCVCLCVCVCACEDGAGIGRGRSGEGVGEVLNPWPLPEAQRERVLPVCSRSLLLLPPNTARAVLCAKFQEAFDQLNGQHPMHLTNDKGRFLINSKTWPEDVTKNYITRTSTERQRKTLRYNPV